MKKYKLLSIIVLSLSVVGCGYSKVEVNRPISSSAVQDPLSQKENEKINQPPVEIEISAVGDIMTHTPQIKAQYNQSTGKYDFTNNFKWIQPYIQKSDLALANFETTLAGSSKPYSGYPQFNSPDQIVDALKTAGFDVLSTANNHSYDTGFSGMKRTAQVIRDKGLMNIGTKESADEKDYIIHNVKGIKVGLISYTYDTNPAPDQTALNGIPVSKQGQDLIHTFSYSELDQQIQKIQSQVQRMKKEGADVIAMFVHWGNEYERQPNENQKQTAQKLADSGVDIIFGSHPHVIQKIDYIHSDVTNKDTLVVYSLGNFLSNQRTELIKKPYTEDGMIVQVTLQKDMNTKKVQVSNVNYVPTWVHLYTRGAKKFYEVLPVKEALEDKQKYSLNTVKNINKAQLSLTNTKKIVEGEIPEKLQTVFNRK